MCECQKKHNCEFYHSKIEKLTHFSQKIYKLSKTNWAKLIHFSVILREQEEKTPKYFAPYKKPPSQRRIEPRNRQTSSSSEQMQKPASLLQVLWLWYMHTQVLNECEFPAYYAFEKCLQSRTTYSRTHHSWSNVSSPMFDTQRLNSSTVHQAKISHMTLFIRCLLVTFAQSNHWDLGACIFQA